jgi:hypothetical protein
MRVRIETSSLPLTEGQGSESENHSPLLLIICHMAASFNEGSRFVEGAWLRRSLCPPAGRDQVLDVPLGWLKKNHKGRN